MKLRRALLRDLVAVSTYAGEGAYGPIYDDPVSVPCNVSFGRQLVRSPDGDEVVSELTVTALPDTADVFTPESLVEFEGRQSSVLDVKPHTVRGRVVFVEVMVA